MRSGVSLAGDGMVKHTNRLVLSVVALLAAGFLGTGTPPAAGQTHRLDAGASSAARIPSTRGFDVSSYQKNVDWRAARGRGARFAYVKATEGTGYVNTYFTSQYNGSYRAGLIRGSYHFALPNRSSGVAQARYFLRHGGRWSRDGRTLPGALDIEYNPYGPTCYGLSHRAMVAWISQFDRTYLAATHVHPVIYTTDNWWRTCTGDYAGFARNNPLWLAHFGSTPGRLPAGWRFQTIWQSGRSGPLPGDQDYFNGSVARLRALANG